MDPCVKHKIQQSPDNHTMLNHTTQKVLPVILKVTDTICKCLNHLVLD